MARDLSRALFGEREEGFGFPERIEDSTCDGENIHLHTGSGINRQSSDSSQIRMHRGVERLATVLNEEPIPGVRTGTVNRDRLIAQSSSNEPRDGLFQVLPRSVVIERSNNH